MPRDKLRIVVWSKHLGWVLALAIAAATWAFVAVTHPPNPPQQPVPSSPKSLQSAELTRRTLGAPVLDSSRFVPYAAQPIQTADSSGKRFLDRALAPSATPETPSRELGERHALAAPFEALDSKTFATGDWEVVLAEVEGPNRGAICFDRDGRLFGCGLRARAALTNALGRGPVLCQSRAYYGHQGMTADCQVDGTDLAQLLIGLGWLRPLGAASEAREAARSEAEAAGRGMWNGGWRLR